MKKIEELLTFESHNKEVQVKLIVRDYKYFDILVSDKQRKVKGKKVHSSLNKESTVKEFHKLVNLLTNQV